MAINPLYMNELEMIESIDAMNEETRQRFQVIDLASLNWTLRKLAAIESKKKEVTELVEAEMERLKQFQEKELSKFQQSEDFFRGLIGEYAARRRDEDPKYKSEKTPYGSIGFRKQQPKWNYDDQALVGFLEKNGRGDLIRVKWEPVKTEIKKVFKVHDDGRVFDENGQEVEGIKVEYLPEVLDIKPEV